MVTETMLGGKKKARKKKALLLPSSDIFDSSILEGQGFRSGGFRGWERVVRFILYNPQKVTPGCLGVGKRMPVFSDVRLHLFVVVAGVVGLNKI